MKPEDLNKEDTYAFVHGNEALKYIGKEGAWHQFVLIEEPNKVWAEVNDSSLHLLKKVN